MIAKSFTMVFVACAFLACGRSAAPPPKMAHRIVTTAKLAPRDQLLPITLQPIVPTEWRSVGPALLDPEPGTTATYSNAGRGTIVVRVREVRGESLTEEVGDVLEAISIDTVVVGELDIGPIIASPDEYSAWATWAVPDVGNTPSHWGAVIVRRIPASSGRADLLVECVSYWPSDIDESSMNDLITFSNSFAYR